MLVSGGGGEGAEGNSLVIVDLKAPGHVALTRVANKNMLVIRIKRFQPVLPRNEMCFHASLVPCCI